MYRPFSKQWLYYDKHLNQRRYQIPNIFPNKGIENKNLVICVTGIGSTKEFSVLMVNIVPDLQLLANGQCFPRYLYEQTDYKNNDLFELSKSDQLTQTEAITDYGLIHFQKSYSTEKIIKEDIFYYVYGLLHSEDYRTRYLDNLKKELPKIPCVKNLEDFWIYCKAGRELADLHINYEAAKPYPVNFDCGNIAVSLLSDSDFRVKQMKFATKTDKSIVTYNNKITMSGIPIEAYEYIVNGKPALEWVMERQAVTTHKDSGIENDANDWAIETMENPRYPLELFQKTITVSLETMKIVKALPRLDI